MGKVCDGSSHDLSHECPPSKNTMNIIEFELTVMDMIYKKNIKDADGLRDFSDQLHQSLELAVEDYALDEGIENYIPVY